MALVSFEGGTPTNNVAPAVHPIFLHTTPFTIAPVSGNVGPTPIHPSTGQNVAAGSSPALGFSGGTAPVLNSTLVGFGSVGTPESPAISSSSTVSASPSIENEPAVDVPNGAPFAAQSAPTLTPLETAVQADLPGGALLSSLPSWLWILIAALVIWIWYTGESPRQVVRRVTAEV